jgi:hypothetical protein
MLERQQVNLRAGVRLRTMITRSIAEKNPRQQPEIDTSRCEMAKTEIATLGR